MKAVQAKKKVCNALQGQFMKLICRGGDSEFGDTPNGVKGRRAGERENTCKVQASPRFRERRPAPHSKRFAQIEPSPPISPGSRSPCRAPPVNTLGLRR